MSILSDRARSVPVLLTTFNRPALTARVLSTLKDLGPKSLFIAQDGPRHRVPGDIAACAKVREVIGELDWNSETNYLLREQNLGCRHAMVAALDWFFRSVEYGIILEDDCIPSPDFFEFAAELLDRYATDERVGMIAGTNLLGAWRSGSDSYHFGYGAVWGWATWRRVWRRYDGDLSGLDRHEATAIARRHLGRARWRQLAPLLNRTARGEIDTWDYQWTFTLAEHGALTAVPAVNLVTNLGFGPDATHTTGPSSAMSNIPVQRMSFPLRHPTDVVRDARFDRRVLALEAGPIIRRFARRSRTFVAPALRRLALVLRARTPRGGV